MSLAVTYDDIRRSLGLLLGHGRDPDAWDEHEREDVDAIIRAGERRVYYYTPETEGKPRHVWSFLRPVTTITLAAAAATYDLPDDFAEMLEGDASLSSGGRLARVSEEHLRSLPARSGTPLYYAVRVKKIAENSPTHWELLLYPTPDDDAIGDGLTLSLRYGIVPRPMSVDNQYPLGGPMHGECFREACLAEAERTLQDEEGIHAKRFAQCLATSIAIDKALQQPEDDTVWPLENPPDGLEVTKAYLKRLIGRELGYGPHPNLWPHNQASVVATVLETGLRKFYSPVVLPGERYPWFWSFLCPIMTITTVEGREVYDLPLDVVTIDGPLTHAPTAAVLYPPIEIVGEHQVRMRQQQSTAQGRPCMAAIRHKVINPTGVSQLELLLWPTPDGDYELKARTPINPNMIPDDSSLPFGGQPHGQTVVEACLAAAEEQNGTANGPHGKKFMERLIASVGRDRQVGGPASLGRNQDHSDVPVDYDFHRYNETIHTYNGVAY